jgi:poly-gamma-glutamate capsule biosynthesis protein CapA/YwtB (metallophosphatase superfamily)
MWRLRDGLIGFLIAVLVIGAGSVFSRQRRQSANSKPVVTSWLTIAIPVNLASKTDAITTSMDRVLKQRVKPAESGAVADWTISTNAGGEPIRWDISGVPDKLATNEIVSEQKVPNLYLVGGTESNRKTVAAALASVLQAKSNRWTLGGLGDIIPGRTVYTVMKNRNDWNYPFEKIADVTKAYDLTLADLEITVADNIAYPEGTSMTFGAPAATLNGLKLAGIDAVNVANNHSANQGTSFFVKMLDTLRAADLPYFGGGKTTSVAKTPYIVTVSGQKIALLGYSSIVGSTAAGTNSPGMNYLSMAPWGTYDQSQVDAMAADIRTAKQQADLVFVYYHWGTEYTHDANDDQRAVAHAAVDAGADLILGTHPHVVQGIEWYKDKLITYNLGNFVFDQDWSVPTQQGVILDATFDGNKLVDAKLRPYRINSTYQPVLASDAESQTILSDIFTHSWWPQ